MDAMTFEGTVRRARKYADHITGLLKNYECNVPEIDEISYLFPDKKTFDDYIWHAKDAGRWMGESAETQTLLWPGSAGREMYDTDYQFIQVDDGLRIEAMRVLNGEAPLHERHLETFGEGAEFVMVHASFKCADIEAYEEACAELVDCALLSLRREYENGYGRFGYYSGVTGVYVKPRVNLRDA